MVSLGILLVIFMAVLCLALALYANVLQWLIPSVWWVVLFVFFLMPESPSGIKDLLSAVAALLAILCMLSINRLKLWNVKNRSHKGLVAARLVWGLFSLILILGTVGQTEVAAYIQHIWTEGGFFSKLWLWLLGTGVFMLLWQTGTQIYSLFERVFTRKQNLVLISCQCVAMPGMIRRFYLSGVNNGKTHHFRITAKTYQKLRREETLTLKVKKGLLGGVYVTELPLCTSKKKTKTKEKKKNKTSTLR